MCLSGGNSSETSGKPSKTSAIFPIFSTENLLRRKTYAYSAMVNYHLDACIWLDYLEDRFGQGGRPLGNYAGKLFLKIMRDNATIFFSKVTATEMLNEIEPDKIDNILTITSALMRLKRVDFTKEDSDEADELSRQRNVPFTDALNAIIARNNNAIMVSQDKHYQKLKDIVETKRPEDLI
jgi:predicted nucleic acid-binding protein